MDELNQQNHVAINSFYASKNMSFARKNSKPKNGEDKAANAQQIKQYLQNVPSRLPREAVRANALKEQHLAEINRITSERMQHA